MVTKLYTIYDRKGEMHYPPIHAHNTPDALRKLFEIFSRAETIFAKFPEDFQIFEVGEYDDSTANLNPCTPHMVCTGTDLLNKFSHPNLEERAGREPGNPA